MLKHLKLTNISSADVRLDFADCLNRITGDNGLGKSLELGEVTPTGQNCGTRHHVQGGSDA